jgi:methionyl-tRNA formyltransferase
MKAFEDLRIIFFGTPEFAVASMHALRTAGAQVVCVVTALDKPAGRGMHVHMSDVKQYALEHNLPLLQPVSMKNPEFLEELRALKADLQVVVAFRMMPEVVWNMPPIGTLNVHGSLLPQYRGAAPINRAIMNGETITGVTTFRLKHEIDTGDILLQHEVAILPEDDAGTLHDKLMHAGAQLLVTTVKGLAANELVEKPQTIVNEQGLHYAKKIFKEDARIDFQQPVAKVHNQVRGLSPYPAAFCMLQGKQLKIFKSKMQEGDTHAEPGTYETDHSTYLRFACVDGWLYVLEVQLEGKKRLGITEFLRGFRG